MIEKERVEKNERYRQVKGRRKEEGSRKGERRRKEEIGKGRALIKNKKECEELGKKDS